MTRQAARGNGCSPWNSSPAPMVLSSTKTQNKNLGGPFYQPGDADRHNQEQRGHGRIQVPSKIQGKCRARKCCILRQAHIGTFQEDHARQAELFAKPRCRPWEGVTKKAKSTSLTHLAANFETPKERKRAKSCKSTALMKDGEAVTRSC